MEEHPTVSDVIVDLRVAVNQKTVRTHRILFSGSECGWLPYLLHDDVTGGNVADCTTRETPGWSLHQVK